MRFLQKTKRRLLRGMSLVEMLMAIFILLIGLWGVTLLFINSWKMNKFVLETGNASLIASRTVNLIVRDIRRARQADNGDYPIESGGENDLQIYIDIDGDGATERVHYYLSNGSIYQGITEPNATMPITYPSGDQTTVLLAQHISNTSSDPVFFYYNKNYPSDIINNPLATPVTVQNVRLIRVHLLVNIDPINAPNNINVESFAELRNLNNYAN
ncbi:MAG: prepilin-type N-terminal cleavage/methylation domain-containing protein [Candidatus Moranbacteria bacterium]|jgi:prepilin-type N-terminal cleavage/methylation domain-containing protein|nr:prepilin-type N-terminal cleavage/methylation domain-containing protein [Candidatus Moranbacteria bacterium]MBP9801783.1 prepilin-type N-terminal cleavage/methylation domain-containing protein [Candidatus Moranbacteria bacterium]